MKKVYVSQNQIDAHMMKDALRRESIPVEIRGEALAGALGELPKFSISPTLWVPEEYYDQAKKVIEQTKKTEDSHDYQAWNCAQCGEENEGHFAECWNCRAKGPDV